MKEIRQLAELKNYINYHPLSILLISSSNCGVCVSVEVKLDQLIEDMKEIDGAKVKIDTIPEVSGEFLVFTVPTILVFCNGKEVIRESRFIQFEKLRENIGKYIQ